MFFEDFEERNIFEYEINDFSEEELEVIRIYCIEFIENLKYRSYIPTCIPPPSNIDINNKINRGIRGLEGKGFIINNGLRLKTYLYYELIFNQKPNYILLLCKMLNFFEEHRKQNSWGDIVINDSLLNEIPVGLLYQTKFLISLLIDLELIQIGIEYLTGNPIFLGITNKGEEIKRNFCQFWNFKTILRYINEVKQNYLFETYENLRVRIVAFNHQGIKQLPETFPYNEILYFRIDFTEKKNEKREPIFSYNYEIGLFEEIISLESIEKRIESAPYLKYNFDNYILEFLYPFPYYFYYNGFKDKLESGYECTRISCSDNGDILNFIFFDHFGHFTKIEYSNLELEGIEFLNDDGSLSNVTEKINNFIGYNLNTIDQPSFAIVLPIKSLKILNPKFKEKDKKKFIKVKWTANQNYHSCFRCKININGRDILIPIEGKEIEIKDFHQRDFPLIFQWSGDPEFFPNNHILTKFMGIKNEYYHPLKNNVQKSLTKSEDLIRNQVDTGYADMNKFLISELQDNFANLRLPQKFCKDFFRVLNFFVNKMVYNNNHRDFIQDGAEEWFEKNRDSSRKEMETKFFHPIMRERLKDVFGEEIIDTPNEARGHIDLKLSFTIPIELKVLKHKKARKREDNKNAFDILESKFTTQIKSEIINSRIGFLVGLDFRKKISRELTIMPNQEYIRFKWLPYAQSKSLIIYLVFLANKKTPSQ
ncbi:MAG: hypothetical protein ACFFCE_01775 [Promethearchaeota archaeon]